MEQISYFNNILNAFKIKAECSSFEETSNYFFYDLKLKPATTIKSVEKFLDEISLAIKAPCKPNIKILHGQGIIRLEFAKEDRKINHLYSLLTKASKPNMMIPCLLGQKTNDSLLWMDLSQNPHMIVSGTTGSGKSTLLHNIIANIVWFSSADLYLIDPKNSEFNYYYNFANVKSSYEDSLKIIYYLTNVMESRYASSRSMFNTFRPQVLIIDEFANLIMQDQNNELYKALCFLAQKCRAANIYIILATQRPSVQTINGNIKANFPARVSCRVASQTDSKIVLDSVGAENLLGYGDALLKSNTESMLRFQVSFTSPNDINHYLYKNYVH